ncbi:hypothetical protein SAMN05414139_03911 [Burkholderia sp. D7]|nr:hypothetical protein SAMN05414139_03911 [Burkholderia sp. D7]
MPVDDWQLVERHDENNCCCTQILFKKAVSMATATGQSPALCKHTFVDGRQPSAK